MNQLASCLLVSAVGFLTLVPLPAQEKSVKPGINDSFIDPNVGDFKERFEVESREVFAKRSEIVAACGIQPGMTVADIGAGTGLFTRMFAKSVGKDGRVVAVDISSKFLDHVLRTSRESGFSNVETLLCTADSTELPESSIDMAYICDTYHHFEFPLKTMASLFRALKPGGKVVVIDFHREDGVSSEWTMNHVRAGKDVFEKEILSCGFQKVRDEKELLKENYFLVFTKAVLEDSAAFQPPGRGRGAGQGRGPGAGQGQGRGPGFGRGMGRGRAFGAERVADGNHGPDAAMRVDQDVFHYLLEHHAEIRRSVRQLTDGVETVTESDAPEIASKIQEHVAAMHERIRSGRGLRFWDELFVAIFRKHAVISMEVENTEKGVRVTETSEDPAAVILIKAHAEVVSQFVAKGFEEAHRNHPVPAAAAALTPDREGSELLSPIISGFGGVVAIPQAIQQPRPGVSVVMDATAAGKPAEVNKALDRAARLLNLYGSAGLKATDVRIALVVHGEATYCVLSDAAYHERFGVESNPNLPLIGELQKAGVEVSVCGQALNYKHIPDTEVAKGIPVAAAAMTVVVNKQADGFSYLPIP